MDELKRIDQKVRETELDFQREKPYLKYVNQGSLRDIYDGHAKYYMYLPAMMKALRPKQVVELGSAGGASTLMMLSHLPKDSMLYACSIPEPEGEFRFIQEEYPNLTLIRGDDLDLTIWKDVELEQTDIWFLDTDHNYEQVHAELTIYDQYFKDGAIVLMDDIHLNEGMETAWDEIEYPKLELNDLHTYKGTGYGMFYVVR